MLEPPTAPPSLSPAEMQILVARAGLLLNPGQVADLVLAWRQVAVLIATIPHNRPLADDMAVRFRLPPPVRGGRDASVPGDRAGASAPGLSAAGSTASGRATGRSAASAHKAAPAAAPGRKPARPAAAGRSATQPAASGRNAAQAAASARKTAPASPVRKAAKPAAPARKAGTSRATAKPAGSARNAAGRIAPKAPRGQ